MASNELEDPGKTPPDEPIKFKRDSFDDAPVGAFNPAELELLNFIEQKYLMVGLIPTKDYCEQIGICSVSTYEAAFGRQAFRQALQDRGISWRADTIRDEDVLTPEQMAAVNLVLDYSDKRTRAAKLKTIGVTTQKWNAWNKQGAFAEHITKRSEDSVGNVSESHISLLSAVQSGDVSAIKLHYEISGRYNPRDQGIDVQGLLVTIISILQRLIPDPVLLSAISTELVKSLDKTPLVLEGKVILDDSRNTNSSDMGSGGSSNSIRSSTGDLRGDGREGGLRQERSEPEGDGRGSSERILSKTEVKYDFD